MTARYGKSLLIRGRLKLELRTLPLETLRMILPRYFAGRLRLQLRPPLLATYRAVLHYADANFSETGSLYGKRLLTCRRLELELRTLLRCCERCYERGWTLLRTRLVLLTYFAGRFRLQQRLPLLATYRAVLVYAESHFDLTSIDTSFELATPLPWLWPHGAPLSGGSPTT